MSTRTMSRIVPIDMMLFLFVMGPKNGETASNDSRFRNAVPACSLERGLRERRPHPRSGSLPGRTMAGHAQCGYRPTTRFPVGKGLTPLKKEQQALPCRTPRGERGQKHEKAYAKP